MNLVESASASLLPFLLYPLARSCQFQPAHSSWPPTSSPCLPLVLSTPAPSPTGDNQRDPQTQPCLSDALHSPGGSSVLKSPKATHTYLSALSLSPVRRGWGPKAGLLWRS